MNTFQLLAHLRDLGVKLRVEDGRLRVDAPRGTITSELRELLTRYKSEILERLAGGARRIEPVPRDEPLCVSFSQERLWFVDRLIPDSPGYITPRALRLWGELDREALQQSLDALVERHESLRTTFREGRDGPVQVVAPPGAAPMRLEDLSEISKSEREPELYRRLEAESRTPFDLATGPLFRTVLYRLGEQDHVLLLLMHHIVTDGWSIGVIERDLGALYRARREGREPELPDLPVQYADFAAWQRDWLQGETLTRQVEYWTQRLSGWSTLELPTDRPRPPMQSFHGARESLSLPASLTGSIEKLSKDAGATLFMTLLAAFKILLQRYTGQDDIMVGTPIAGRTQAEVEGLVGFFVNTVALRTDVSGDPTFRELLTRVREVTLGAFRHQDLPFEKLVEELAPERDLSRNPLFQVSFALQNAFATEARLEELAVSPVSFDRHNSVFDLSVNVWTDDGGLRVNFVYSTDLFDTATIRRMAGHFRTLVEGIVAEPGARLSELPILTAEEHDRLRFEWNDTDREFPRDQCLHQLIEEQVRNTPDAPAVVYQERVLTYAELNARANQVAHALRSRCVGRGMLVGLCIERCPDMVVAVLGILKSGAAYVPLDPAYPGQRLAYILEETRTPVVLTREGLVESLPAGEAEVIRLDADWPGIAENCGNDPETTVDPADLAYVIYTSGSTGQPKGVAVPHRGVVNYLDWCSEFYEVAAHEGSVVHSSLAFDLTVTGLFSPLIVGRSVRLVPEEPGLDALVESIRAGGPYSPLKITPAHLRLLAQQMSPEELARRVRTVVVGGEALTSEHLAPLRLGGSDLVVVNEYGPTETVVGSCVHRTTVDAVEDGPIPIGRPIANTRLQVLDRHLRPVPVGVTGELYIGGVGVTRGYLHRPELTAERFVPDSLSEIPGDRAYRTGDLVRYRPDGILEFLGRLDDQVKIRGYRIELGEVEANLVQSPLVEDAAVVCREDERGEKELVAYVVGAGGREPSPSDLRRRLGETLTDYMIPSTFVFLESMPLTPNGKVDRRALPAPGRDRQVDELYVAPRGELASKIAAIWCEILSVDEVGVHDNFFELGGHSLLLWQLRTRLAESTGREVPVTDLFRYPTVASLAGQLSSVAETGTPLSETARQRMRAREGLAVGTGAIAIVGLACRFPEAPDPDRFWNNLREGVESVRFFSHDELRDSGVEDDVLRDPAYVRAKGYLEDADRFDPSFFDYSPREASLIDPQQRLFLECAWEALESAGYDPERYDGRIGVYAGVSLNSYAGNLRSDTDLMRMVGAFNVSVANDKDFVPTRVAYKLNLRGPAINVQTACSTSLVAVHQACQSLFLDECTMALAGGASVTLPLKSGYLYQEGGILSSDGHCRTFDAEASGTLGGNGVGIVLLKRLQDAVEDGDPIHAVIRGSAINNDGSLKVGFTAPGVEGQAEVIATAQAMAGVDPDTIGYVEAHGTGTALGDPIEVSALTQVFRERTDRERFCAIGSLKSNVGHMDAAAGVGSLIKTVLALRHGVIPPSLHFREANPKIGIEDSPFYVAAKCEDWQTDGGPRRAGVSSFGIGGTNAHVVLEEAPPVERSSRRQGSQLLTLSARTGTALEAATANLSRYLEGHPELSLSDVAWTLQVGRRGFSHRRVLVCSDVAGAVEALRAGDPQRMPTAIREAGDRPVIFMFTGQGSQYPNMGRGLYDTQPSYRETVDRCCDLLSPGLGFDLREVLFPEDDRLDEAAERIARTEITQPALFVTEYALAQLWMEWGIRPRAMIGHSIGEYVAACLGGEFSLEDGLRLVAARGRLMGSLPGGSMLAVPLPEADVRPRLPKALSVAAINAPGRCVVSGPDDAIESFAAALEADGTPASRLRTSHAFHSSMMDPILDPFIAEVERTPRRSPSIPYVSNVSGAWKTEGEAADPGYWARHLRSCVRFADGLAGLLSEAPEAILLEVGPGDTLASLGRRHPGRAASHCIVTSVRHPKKDDLDREFLLGALGKLWIEGVEPDWVAIHGDERPNRVSLPTYPFERERYWIEKRDAAISPARRAERGKKPDLSDWFYIPSWRRSLSPGPVPAGDGAADDRDFLVFSRDTELDRCIADRLASTGHGVTVVRAGASYEDGKDGFTIDPRSPDDYRRVLEALSSAGRAPDSIVHLWCASGSDPRVRGEEVSQSIDLGFHSLIALAQALGEAEPSRSVRLDVVTAGVHEVTGDEAIHPERAAVLGPCRVIPIEYDNLECRNVDLSADDRAAGTADMAADVVGELLSDSTDPIVALRNGRRWVEGFEAVRLDSPGDDRPTLLRPGGVYLITGGLGGIALELAGYLAATAGARLVLVARAALPERAVWESYAAERGEDDVTTRRIRAVQALEEAGAEVMVGNVDITDLDAMRSLVESARARFGAIHGVIHAAGVAGGGMIQVKTRADAERVLTPKVDGARVLERLFEATDLDFMVLCSSLNSVKGFPGQADYCAANAYLDAYAHRFAADTGTPTIAIDWKAWREVGMAVNVDLPAARKAQRLEELARTGISNAEGVEVFRRILACGAGPQVLVSSEDLEAVLSDSSRDRRTAPEGAADTAVPADSDVATLDAYPRPDLQTPYVEPRNDTERILAEIWKRLLGIDQVGVDDNFYELGGDSLIGIQLIARAKEVGLELSPKAVFEQQTIADLAKVAGARAAEATATVPETDVKSAPDLVAVDRTSELPLSFSQQRLWFLDQLDSGSAYNLPYGYRLSGPLDLDDLRSAVNALVERHEALRTCFPVVEGNPVQRVRERLEIEIPLIDLGDTAESDHDAEIDRLVQTESDHRFDLARGPLLRTKLVRLADREHVLIVNMHHIVSDGWSMDVFFRDLNELYRARHEDREPNLPLLPVQYPDYAVWQRRWMDNEVLQEQLEFWRTRLEGLEVLNLPTDRPRPATQTFGGASYRFSLPRELSESLTALSRDSGVTPFMTMLAASQTLLHRYTGQDDIVVASPIAGRTRPETESLIGFFVNALLLRTDFSGDPTFTELLARVREVALSAYRNQDLPFERLVEEMDPKRDLSQNPLFQVVFVYNAPRSRLDLPGLEVTPYRTTVTNARNDMEFYVSELPGGFACNIVYRTDLYDASTIERMAEHFRTLLENVAANPGLRASRVEILPQQERGTLLVDWNRFDADYPDRSCIHELFEARVAESPESIAVVCGDRDLNYAELNVRANQIAQTLRPLGVGPDVRVALCVERGLDMIVGLLGILKAGGAYIPIDPAYPSERLAFMLSDSGASVMLTQETLLPGLPKHGGRVLCLDRDRDEIASARTDEPSRASSPDDVAYVIYTSGSTGIPKGVLLEHRGVCNLATAQIEAFGIGPGSRVLQFAAFSFDASVSEVFTALAAGATLVLAPRHRLLPGPDLVDLLNAERVSTVTLPPSVLSALPDAELPHLETLVSAGEPCTTELVQRWGRGRRFLNAYGPTEVTVCATIGRCDAGDEQPPTIGRPMANVKVYVLDRKLQPVPVGAVGELCVGGPGLARGYLGRPELTAERFIPDPFDADGPSRLYRTGDRVRYRSDGRIEYLGRADEQVKVRGYRIEPGEVENVLRRHPEVHDVIVLKSETVPVLDDREDAQGPSGHEGGPGIELWPSIAEFYVYDEILYHIMTNDEHRNRSYRAAIDASVRDKVVLDIGTGRDAILARLCVESGARKVYAVEMLEESYVGAKETLERLGLRDRIELILGDSTKVDLPEKVDVCVSEIVGAIGGSEGAARIINDAHRFMQTGGLMIPGRSTTRIAAVSLPEAFIRDPRFNKLGASYVPKIFEQVGRSFDLRLCLKSLTRDYLASTEGVFEDLDFNRPIDPEGRHRIELQIENDTVLHGFVVWLTLETIPGEMIDILDREYCWLPVFLPVFPTPIEVSGGDRIVGEVTRTLCENGLNPDYRVAGSVRRSKAPDVSFDYTSYHEANGYRHTPFYAQLFGDEKVRVATSPGPGPHNAGPEERLVAYLIPSSEDSAGRRSVELDPTAVRESTAVTGGDAAADQKPDVQVAPAFASEEAEAQGTAAGWEDDHVSQWQTLYERSFAEAEAPEDRTFQIADWDSSYTGEAIPAREKQEWVNRTVESILSGAPRKVLEIGCGTGLLLFRIAPHCEEYVGFDFSQSALDYVAEQLPELGSEVATVTLERRRADDLGGIERGRFDTVILNSVIQYFPSADYLLRVLEGLVETVRPGGRIFVGDVRSLPLIQAFHTSVQLWRAEDEMGTEQLRRRIRQQMNQDQELVVDPQFFFALRRRVPRIGRVEIRPKPGRYDNELSRFRYDLVLHVEGDQREAPVSEWLDWVAEDLTLEAVRDRLRGPRCRELALTGVPNRRILQDLSAVELLDAEDCPASVKELRRRIDEAVGTSKAVDPEDLRALCDELPYEMFASWAAGRADGSFDIVFRRREDGGPAPAFPRPQVVEKPLLSYTNSPLRGRRLQGLVSRLREHASKTLPEYMIPSAFVVLDEFPVTPSGKVDRRALPAPDTLRPELAQDYAAPRTPAEIGLANAWAQVLSLERVGIQDNFFELGGDSILSIQVVVAAREAGLEITARDLFQHQTVEELARVAGVSTATAADQGPVCGLVAPTPIQHWFFDQELVDPHHFNQALVLQLGRPIDPEHLERVFERLIAHHDVLRIRARRSGKVWQQEIVEPGDDVPLEVVDLTRVPVPERAAFVEERSSRIQAGLDLDSGPVIRAALYRGDAQTPDHLAIAVHHLAVDGVSWRILLDDLTRGVDQAQRGEPIRFPPKTTSVQTWAERLDDYARSPDVAAEAKYWLELPWNEVSALPVDFDCPGDNTAGAAGTVTVTLDRDRTQALLRDVPGAYNTEINDALLTALVRTVSPWIGRDRLLVDLEGHGREEVVDGVDLSQTVGWFTTIFPVILRTESCTDVGADLRSIKEQLRAVPGRGLAYGLARNRSADELLRMELRRHPAAEVAFNYLGQFDSVLGSGAAFQRAGLSAGPQRSPRGRRTHLLEINASVLDGSLRVNWTYGTTIHREETIRRLADRYLGELNELVEHCVSADSVGYTPSDFSEFDWSQTDIADIVDELKKRH